MQTTKKTLKDLPGVDKLLLKKPIQQAIEEAGADTVKYVIREVLQQIRSCFIYDGKVPEEEDLLELIVIVRALSAH